MYSVLLIDDEKKNLLLLRRIISWEDYGFRISGQATDGEKGLSVYRKAKPDLIFVDLRMPIMDGLEFIKQIRTYDKVIPIVILTAFDEFTYAQSAISLQVMDYLLKPIDRRKLANTLKKAYACLHHQQKEMQDYIKIKDELSKSKVQSLLKQFCLTKHLNEEQHIVINRLFSNYSMSVAMAVDSLLTNVSRESLLEQIYQFHLDDLHFFIFETSKEQTLVNAFWETVRKGEPQFLILGEHVKDCYGFFEQYRLLREKSDAGFYKNHSQIFYLSSLVTEFAESTEEVELEDTFIDFFVETGNAEEIIHFVHQKFKTFSLHDTNPKAVKAAVLDFLITLKLKLKFFYSDELFSIFYKIENHDFQRYYTAMQLEKFLVHVLEQMATQIQMLLNDQKNNLPIQRALSYTKRNCFSSSFSEQNVAIYANLSKSYFVKLFQEQTGTSLWNYVTGLRIEKAKELLRKTSLPIGEISIKVGYVSPCHFNRKFKAIVGITPNDYRNCKK